MPMTMAQAMVKEMEIESAATRKMLERLPEEKMAWRPHDKSMTLARLAGHIAETPHWAANILDHEAFDFTATEYTPFAPESRDQLLAAFEQHLAGFNEALEGRSDAELLERWELRGGDKVYMSAARVAALRGLIVSHMIHHRGQLTVYLRLLGVPVPGAYGPTADES